MKNIFLSWTLGHVVRETQETHPDLLCPEYARLAESVAKYEKGVRSDIFDIVSVELTVPQLQRSFRYTAASRMLPQSTSLSVARALREQLSALYGPSFQRDVVDLDLRIVTLPGVGEFLKTWVRACASEQCYVPYNFWSQRERIIELPLSPDEIRQLFAYRDERAGRSDFLPLCDGWVRPGVSADSDQRILMAAAGLLGLNGTAIDAPDDDEE